MAVCVDTLQVLLKRQFGHVVGSIVRDACLSLG